MYTLRGSLTSPYVRKSLALALETGLRDRIEFQKTDPWSADTDLGATNPLGKIPALVGGGLESALFDSPVICEYLDSQHGGRRFFPAEGPARWKALRLQAIGDGIADAAVSRLLDTRRPEGQQSADWQKRQKTAIARACDVLEKEAADLEGEPTIGTLAVAVALGYLDLRWSQDNWRDGRPALARWFEGFNKRPSMTGTAPA